MTSHTLRYPVWLGDTAYKTLHFRSPVASDVDLMVRAAKTESATELIHIIARMADVPAEAISKIDLRDFHPLLSSFLTHISQFQPPAPPKAKRRRK